MTCIKAVDLRQNIGRKDVFLLKLCSHTTKIVVPLHRQKQRAIQNNGIKAIRDLAKVEEII